MLSFLPHTICQEVWRADKLWKNALVYFGSKFCPHISVHNFNLLPSNIAFLPPAFNMQMPAGLSRDPHGIGWKDSIPFLIVDTNMSIFLGFFFYFDKLWLIIIVNLFSWLQCLSGKLDAWWEGQGMIMFFVTVIFYNQFLLGRAWVSPTLPLLHCARAWVCLFACSLACGHIP